MQAPASTLNLKPSLLKMLQERARLQNHETWAPGEGAGHGHGNPHLPRIFHANDLTLL